MKKIVLVVAFAAFFGFSLVACACKKEQTAPATAAVAGAVDGEESSQDVMTTSTEEVAQ
ncbi:MAG: hypothetical protein LE180_02050 [Endomicrobium sp.]|uniref:hypothetical protein n=1 Tax=Candidatus Endomicrobiellum pyrsonymphae TaxID=1408203 RepID=UPI0035805D34|nr:hypothetical protein [Endomicrobium sp.]